MICIYLNAKAGDNKQIVRMAWTFSRNLKTILK